GWSDLTAQTMTLLTSIAKISMGSPTRVLATTVVGLLSLLIVPVVARNHAENYHRQVEDHIEPARQQIDRTIEIAYELQSRSLCSPFTRAVRMGLSSTAFPNLNPGNADRYDSLLQEWQAVTANDHDLAYCGPAALRAWKTGKDLLGRWLDRDGRPISGEDVY